jgi:hypothetical protein
VFPGLLLAALLGGCDSGSSGSVAAPVVTLTAPASVMESDGTAAMTLTLASGPDVTVSYASAYGSAGADDITAVSGSVRLTAAAPTATVAVPVTNDAVAEGNEAFAVNWAASVPGTVLPAPASVTLIDDDALTPLPAMGDWQATGLFNPAADCTACHRASDPGVSPAVLRTGTTAPDPAGDDISPGTDWSHTLLAHAFNDPWYRAKVSAEAAQHPELAGFIEDKCLNCHAPMARTQAHEDGRLATVDATCPYPGGCLRLASADADPMSREGISCTLCHRIDGRVLTEDRNSGDYPLDSSALPLIFGPFDSPVTAPMVNQLGKSPAAGAQMAKSEHCASCHDLFTPVIDAVTNEPNGNTFPEQTPYREWRNSDYAEGRALAAGCQDCHMPAVGGGYETRLAVRADGSVNTAWPLRSPYARHVFVGGNVQMLQVLRDFRTELGIDGKTTVAGFDGKIAETRAFIAQAAELHIDRVAAADGTLAVDVRVVNRTGHKLPTGFPSRRMWIALVVRDGGGATVFSSGIPDAAGRLPLDAVLASSTCTALSAPLLPCLVPHRDRVTDAYDVPVYESVLADTHDGVTHTLLHAAGFLKDNRLPPVGFRATDPRYDPRTAVVGVGADPDFAIDGSGSDTVHYAIAGAGAGPWTVEARLYMQSIRPDFIAAMNADTAAVHDFRVMMARVPPLPEVIATATTP